MTRRYHLSAILALFLVGVLPTTTFAETDAEKATKKALNESTEVMPGCGLDDVKKRGIDLLNWSQSAEICELIANRLGKMPEVRVLRFVSYGAIGIAMKSKETPENLAYQIMNVIELRNDTTPEKIINTVNVIYKVWGATDHRVFPKDLNIALRKEPQVARVITDDQIYALAGFIYEAKKANGE